VGLLAVLELTVLGMIIYLRWQERRRMAIVAAGDFEERSIVVPGDEPPPSAPHPPARRRRRGASDPEGAYLAALDALERDGRWPRNPDESPRAHARRAAAEGLGDPGFGRLALAYQLVRYGGRRLPRGELGRTRERLGALLRRLGR